MRIIKTTFDRSTRSARWVQTGSETLADGIRASIVWKRVRDAIPFNRSIGGYERLSGNELTSISPDRLSKSVFRFC
ncbi:MAG: hypothetical protein K2I40_04765 [Bifidobacterium castoris]|nr:hypothetical protein [Bifidobacterium castoris]